MLALNHEYNPDELFLVGIAASAGGILPMRELLAQASCHGSMSFVVVSHVARYRPSELSSILERASNITSIEIADGMEIQNCRLYTIPPNKYVILKDSRFEISDRPSTGPNNSGDVFFQSLSVNYGQNAIGVVLSGAGVGADGSAGVKDIKHRHGQTFAQTPSTAEFPDMPKLAIETGCIDIVASADEIGRKLSMAAWAAAK